MKREIKFRVWDNQAKKMSSTFNPLEGEKPTIYGEAIYSSDAVYMQFTGRKDKNGKDIYEGDIVNISTCFGYIKNMQGVNAIYIVSFKTCEYLLFRPDINLTWGRLSRLEEMNYNCEVIGNIYENPELLNTTEDEQL